MAVGWALAAVTGVVPYLFLPRGQGSSGAEFLSLARSAWLSLHVWLSFGMAAFTLAHVMLNRGGVARAFRVVSGRRVERRGSAGGAPGQPRPRPGWAWLAVTAVLAGLIVGGLALVPDHGSGGTRAAGRDHQVERGLDVPVAEGSLGAG
ncbi:MAG: DUF4405 domain-containing protein [Acidimicrobiia bacterium]|nr:DUF4405 domain-containing protein [Acidimicrobiia bacterium]